MHVKRFVVLACVLIVASSLPGAEVKPAVRPADELRFEQEKALAHMRELEERMFRLGELIRNEQPDDSARLLMGVRRAREQLIAEQMKEVTDLITRLSLTNAGKEQLEILRKLEELKQLLLAADMDLTLKLEQLRKLREAKKAVEKLIARETAQKQQTGETQKKPEAQTKQTFDALKDDEQRNQRTAGEVQKQVESVGPMTAGAAASVGGAGQSMGSAAGHLGESAPKPAGEKQAEAIKQLQDAKRQLEEQEKKLQEQMEPLIRRQVMENLAQMLSDQQKVREATDKLAPRVAEKNPQAVLAVQRLSPAEEKIRDIGQKTIALVEETGFSVALPPAMREVDLKMALVSEDLHRGRANESVVLAERVIEADLEALLDAMKSSAPPKGGKPGQCSSCKGNLNKLLAEVKMLRWMQASVAKETKEVDDANESGQLLSDDYRQRSAQLKEREAAIREASEKLHERTCPECLRGGEQ